LLSIESHVNERAWDDQIAAAGGSVFHTSAWAAYGAAERPGSRPLFVRLASRDGALRAAAVVFELRSSRWWLGPFSGEQWTDSYPVAASGDEGAAAELIRALAAQDRGAVELTIGSFGSTRGGVDLRSLGFETWDRLEFEIQLDPPEEAIFGAMDKIRRQKIRKAEKRAIVVADLTLPQGLLDLRRLQAESAARITGRGGPQIGRAADADADPVRILVERGAGRIVGALLDGECVSAGFFTRFGDLVYYTLSGHDARGLESQAPTLLLWETMKRYRGEGARRFNLGGCSASAQRPDSPEHGVYNYKKDFGSVVSTCVSGRQILRPVVHRLLSRLRGSQAKGAS
jgi:hypothetical protein